MVVDWSWAFEGITDETPRTTGPECINYMTNRRRWIEALFFTIFFILIIRWTVKRMDPIVLPPQREIDRPHSATRLLLLIAMTWVFGIELGFKLAGKSVIFVLNPCHIQTIIQIYLLAAKPSKTTIALFRIQMNNLNGPFLAFILPEVECRTLPFEQATYWIQHALLYIIPVYILKSGAYKIEDFYDYNWVTIGVAVMLLYHFVVLNAFSIFTGINLNHMLCAALADPFQGQNYRIAAVIHESILCPILNKATVLLFCSADVKRSRQMPLRMLVRSGDCAAAEDEAGARDEKQQQDNSNSNSNIDRRPTSLANNHSATAGAAGTTPANSLLYHQQRLMSDDSLAAELRAALGCARGGAASTDSVLRHRALPGEHRPTYGGDADDMGSGEDGLAMFTPTAAMPMETLSAALDKEVEMLLQQEEEQQQHQQKSSLEGSVGEFTNTMPTTKID